jgi:CDP-glucose 4,6-dehydratase
MTYGMLKKHLGKFGSMEQYFNRFYQGKKVLITGNTGFKGSWMGEWLTLLGAEVYGLSLLDGKNEQHFEMLAPSYRTFKSDIRNFEEIQACVKACQPEIVFHLAAQALVIDSYETPVDTYGVNVMGTLHVLEACRQVPSVKAVVVVTSDKCYENREWIWGYRENDPFGGHDMYSSSKGCAEILTQSFRRSFCCNESSFRLASARAGNVIGGGDFSENRIIPDLVRSVMVQGELEIRNPKATRPWQHVLEPVSGYLLLGQQLVSGQKSVDEGWNFGPSHESNCSVEALVKESMKHWNAINYHINTDPRNHHEAHLLMLDCSKAHKYLHWSPVWGFKETVEQTMLWYKIWNEEQRISTRDQIVKFCEDATNKGAVWA